MKTREKKHENEKKNDDENMSMKVTKNFTRRTQTKLIYFQIYTYLNA